MRDVRQLLAALVVLAVMSVVAWIGWGVYVWAGVMMVGAAAIAYMGFRPPKAPPSAARTENDVVAVRSVPNVPLAEMVVGQLRDQGIEAFYKVMGGLPYPGSANPAGWCDIYVSQRDARRARELVPQAGVLGPTPFSKQPQLLDDAP